MPLALTSRVTPQAFPSRIVKAHSMRSSERLSFAVTKLLLRYQRFYLAQHGLIAAKLEGRTLPFFMGKYASQPATILRAITEEEIGPFSC